MCQLPMFVLRFADIVSDFRSGAVFPVTLANPSEGFACIDCESIEEPACAGV